MLSDGNALEAERLYRAALTWYLAQVHSHTLAVLSGLLPAPPFLPAMLHFDIETLGELLSALGTCFVEQGRSRELIPLCDHVELIAPLPGITERLLSIKIIWWNSVLNEPERARAALGGVSDVRAVSDRHLLQVYLDLAGFDMPTSLRLEIVEKILAQPSTPEEALQYMTLRAMTFALLDRPDDAWDATIEALRHYAGADARPSAYGKSREAEVYSVRWNLRHKDEDLRAALAAYDAIPREQLRPAGIAMVLDHKGELLRAAGRFQQSEACFVEALEHHPRPEARLHLARLCADNEDPKRAALVLAEVARDTLSPEASFEYVIVSGVVALEQGDRAQLRTVAKELRELKTDDSYFRWQRDQICLEVYEYLLDDPAAREKELKETMENPLDGVRRFAQYLHLKPNIFGLGIDLNRVIGGPRGR